MKRTRTRVVQVEHRMDEPGQIRQHVVLNGVGETVCLDERLSKDIYDVFLGGHEIEVGLAPAPERLSVKWMIADVRKLRVAGRKR